MKVVIDGKEYIEKRQIENLIYNLPIFGFEEERFKEIEKALGFRLFKWQKTYILHGKYRQTGRTTAECLRLLIDVEGTPLDFSKRPSNKRLDFFRDCLKKIQEKLMESGIPTRTVFWCKADIDAYRTRCNKCLNGVDVIKDEVVDDDFDDFAGGAKPTWLI